MRRKLFTVLSLIVTLAIVSEARSATFFPISSATTDPGTFDFFPAANIFNGPGAGFDASAPHNVIDTRWVTDAPGGGLADYITTPGGGMPVITLDLGADVALEEISYWGYDPSNGNGVSVFSLRFATAAEGTGGFGSSIAFNPTYNPANTNLNRQSFGFGQTVNARYVEFTAVDNYFGGPAPGGDRVGLNEIAFQSDFVFIPPTPPLVFYPIASVETPNAVDFFSKENMIEGIGTGFSATFPHDSTGPTWVTDTPNGAGDYYGGPNNPPAPEIIIDLGEDVLLTEISIWGYATGNTNGIRDFNLEFATAAEGTGGFGSSITFNPAFVLEDLDLTPRHGFDFSQDVTARYVKLTVTDNQRGFHGAVPGGDRVGIGEIGFVAVPEPSTIILAVLGLVGGLFITRRRK